jgi:hypothetical protein
VPELDRTCVYESGVKIQVVQTRRILLLFTLVLGATALVASLAAPPEDDEEPAVTTPAPATRAPDVRELRFSGGVLQTRRADEGTRVTVVVDPREPGEVELPALGLRQSTDERTPARFEILARDTDVRFHELGGRTRLLGRLNVRLRRPRG